ncbi:MAG: hypothetical protein IPF99_39740 [Deltaproteobacteria bacterium]|nr:hypothetical protein [Deltaproteobacteria bacterium]
MRPIARDALGVLVALAALGGSWWALERAREKTDPRRAVVRMIRREAGPRDLVVVTDEAPELVAMASPVPALWGVPQMDDLHGVRRVYGVAPTASALAPLLGRFGSGATVDREGRALRWEIAAQHLGRVVFDASHELGARVTAERVGGADNGPCPLEGAVLGCHGPEWNRVRAEPHRFDGAEMRCIYAHPQTDGTLTFRFTGSAPGARSRRRGGHRRRGVVSDRRGGDGEHHASPGGSGRDGARGARGQPQGRHGLPLRAAPRPG